MTYLREYGETLCPKCEAGAPAEFGNGVSEWLAQPTIKYHTKDKLCVVLSGGNVVYPATEHLHVWCSRCGFAWATPTADAR